MAKIKTVFVCQNCGHQNPKWAGKCPNCGSWNSLVEETIAPKGDKLAQVERQVTPLKTNQLSQADLSIGHSSKRLPTGFGELDEVLGGGFLPGGVNLLAGQPGIGKSTILMQLAGHLAGLKQKVLYVSGEESDSQVAARAKRLLDNIPESLWFAASINADQIASTILQNEFDLVIVDSIQTMQVTELTSAAGTVSQITASTNLLIRAAKQTQTALVIVGHVTKEGNIAGPKIMEHLVDVVLQFEGDRYGGFKTIRAVKNRYGSTSEAAIFEMTQKGLQIVKNPSEVLLRERTSTDGSIILATIEGNQPLLVEVQALVNTTNFGYPKRTASGFDVNRLNLLIAILERRTKLNLSDKDIYVNVVGGLKLRDAGADLAVVMAIASNLTERRLDPKLVVFGEVGLGGEIRSVPLVAQRLKEARKMGFRAAVAPRGDSRSKFIEEATDLRQILIKYLERK